MCVSRQHLREGAKVLVDREDQNTFQEVLDGTYTEPAILAPPVEAGTVLILVRGSTELYFYRNLQVFGGSLLLPCRPENLLLHNWPRPLAEEVEEGEKVEVSPALLVRGEGECEKEVTSAVG